MTIETNIAVYLGPPTFAYQIGDIHLSREGILSGNDLDGIFPFLEMQGIVVAQPKTIQESAENTAPGIQIPLEGYTPMNLRNLIITLYSKQWLILVQPSNMLEFVLADGRVVSRTWKDHSRRESWTPEKREQTRQKMMRYHSERRACANE